MTLFFYVVRKREEGEGLVYNWTMSIYDNINIEVKEIFAVVKQNKAQNKFWGSNGIQTHDIIDRTKISQSDRSIAGRYYVPI